MPRVWLGEGLTVLAEVALALRERGHDPAVAASACDRLRSFTAGCPVNAARALRAAGLQLLQRGDHAFPAAVRIVGKRAQQVDGGVAIPVDQRLSRGQEAQGIVLRHQFLRAAQAIARVR